MIGSQLNVGTADTGCRIAFYAKVINTIQPEEMSSLVMCVKVFTLPLSFLPICGFIIVDIVSMILKFSSTPPTSSTRRKFLYSSKETTYPLFQEWYRRILFLLSYAPSS